MPVEFCTTPNLPLFERCRVDAGSFDDFVAVNERAYSIAKDWIRIEKLKGDEQKRLKPLAADTPR